MTVKEAVSVLKYAKKIVIGWGDSAIPFHKENALMMEAYGNFVVESIRGYDDVPDEGYYEINVAVSPVKAGA